ncbi:nucleotidyltransferase family protein [Larkinella sp. C7]|jgi:predicted nucleotidyltransferase|uniref:nucleotidyltransferase family protein n=1 Tax=Larkinella sp. C7 TaxID=2576607 RepID=UPI001111108C|nr:nucleotidyltransferase domain-containing protein [Larkinella sp. C7]
MLTSLIERNLETIRQIASRHHVNRLYAFGSACTGNFSTDSDIDLLLSFDQKKIKIEDYADNYFELAEELETLLGRPVELVEEVTLQNPYFIRSVNRTKIPILE